MRAPKHISSTYWALVSALLVTSVAEAAVIEEITITANRRAQDTQDVGVAVSAFSGDDVKDLNLKTATDLAAQTPGLSTTNGTSGGTPIFSIRGIGLDDFNINNSSGVGVYVDDVFASSPMLLGFQLMDVERVEVLKGPQGTLYGKNTTGGAINFVTFKPSDEFSASIEAGVGRWGRVDLGGHVNGSLSDSVNGRLAWSYANQSEGWQTDIDTGEEFGEVDKIAFTGKLDFILSDQTSVLVNVHYGKDESKPISPQNDDSEARANDTLFLGGLLDGQLDVPPDSTSVRVGGLNVRRDETGFGGAVTVTHDFDAATLLSITSFDTYERAVVDNYDGTAVDFLDLDQNGELDQLSQEFRLTSAGDGDYTWVVGASYSTDEVDVSDDFLLGFSAGVNLTSAYKQETDSFGLYFHNEYYVSDAVKLIGGIRYSNDKRTFNGGTFSLDGSDLFGGIEAIIGAPPNPGDIILANNASRSEDNVSGKLGINIQVSDNLLTYANVSTSYKAGLFYGGVGTVPGSLDYVTPEEVTAIEVGFKSTLLDGSLQLNGAVFSYDYEDRQSLVIVDDPVLFLTATLANVPESKINGAELDFWWKPTDNLDIKGGVSFLDTEVENDLTSADVRGLSLFSVVPAGTALSQAPELSYNLLMTYSWDLSSSLFGRAQVDYSRSDAQFAALADPVAQYGPIYSTGARFTMGSQDGNWELALYGKNLGDETLDTYSFTNNSGARTVYRQKPRYYGLSFLYFFL